MSDVTAILAECLESIETGQRTQADCLHAYPQYRDELQALFETHQQLSIVAPIAQSIVPSADFRSSARARLLSQLEPRVAPSTTRKPEPLPPPTLLDRLRAAFLGPRRGLTFALVALMLIMTTTSGTLYAATQSIPGSPVYGIKTSIETYQLNRVENESDLIDLQLTFADERLAELEQLVERERDTHIKPTANRYAGHVEEAIVTADNLESADARTSEAQMIQERLNTHTPRIEDLDQAIDTLLVGKEADAADGLIAMRGAIAAADTFAATGVNVVREVVVSIYKTLQDEPRFADFVTAIQQADLSQLVAVNGPFTLFVPLNGQDELLSTDEKLRRQRILYHLIQGEYDATALAELGTTSTALGTELVITQDEDGLILNGSARVVSVDIPAYNGTIHFIDTILDSPEYYP